MRRGGSATAVSATTQSLMSLAQQITENGFVFLPKHMVELSTLDAAMALGTRASLPGLDDVQILMPRHQTEATPNIYSGVYGYNEFPLHTDLAHWAIPPRYLLLRCISGTKDVPTRLLDSTFLADKIGEVALERTLVMPRRPTVRGRSIFRVLSSIDTKRLFRWDSLFLIPATPRSAEVCDSIGQHLRRARTNDFTLSDPADTLIVDNWRVLHGRSPVPQQSSHRRVDRVYLEALL